MISRQAKRRLLVSALVVFSPVCAGAASLDSGASSVNYKAIRQLDEPGQHTIVNPGGLLERPNAGDVSRAYPAAALKQQINGRAALDCRVAVNGRLAGCTVAFETPGGSGFGEAALSLAPRILMHSASYDGVPVPGFAVRIPFTFDAFPAKPIPDAPPGAPQYAPVGSMVPPPPELDGIVPPKGRLSILGVTTNGTIMTFLGLEDQVQRGAFVDVTLFSVSPPSLGWRGPIMVSRERIDCENKTVELKARRDLDENGNTIGWSWFDFTSALPATPKTDIGEAVRAVCQHMPPSTIVSSADEAFKVARFWPGSK